MEGSLNDGEVGTGFLAERGAQVQKARVVLAVGSRLIENESEAIAR